MRRILRPLSLAWRLVAGGFGVAVFFGGGALLALTAFPLIRVLSRDPAVRHRNTQRAIHRIFRGYLRMLQLLGVISVDLSRASSLATLRGKMIVANHPTLLDVVLLMAVVPRVQCIVKHQLWSSPFLGGVVRQAGYIRNDMQSEQLVAACRRAIDSGRNIIVFPQGTRSHPGAALRFHRGFANIALLAQADIQTVRITCEPLYLGKGEPWWRVPPRIPKFTLISGESVEVGALMSRPRALAARSLVRQLEFYYAGSA